MTFSSKLSPKPSSSDWETIAASKRAQLAASLKWILPSPPPDTVLDVTSIPESCGILNDHEIKLTQSTAATILGHISSGYCTAEEVTVAFCKRAAIAQQLVNCLSEVCFDEAIARAKELDTVFRETGKLVGPLHGLPVSIKDCFKINGLDSTLGFVCWANKPLEEDSTLITILRGLGAVVYCKTNVPTAMMIAETYNNVFGRTLNPYNRSLSSGGSSGGEAALLALKGSPLGIGTDIGGSIRIPGSFCGLYSLRPSFGRFPTGNTRSGMAGQEAINSVNGPLSPSLASLILYSSTILSSTSSHPPWSFDPKVVPMPWRSSEMILPRKLSFGVIRHDGIVRPHPPMERAIETVIKALIMEGHEVIDFKPYEHELGSYYLAKCFHADGGTSIRKLINATPEPWPLGLRSYQVAGKEFHPSTYEMWQLQLARTEYMKNYLEHWMRTKAKTSTGREVDFVLCPTTAYAACRHDTFEYVGYTGVWNAENGMVRWKVVDYSAATIPVLFASSKLDARTPSYNSYTPKSELDERIWKSYDPEDYEKAPVPVGVQLVGRRMQEEKVLAGCKVVEDALRTNGTLIFNTDDVYKSQMRTCGPRL